MPFCSEKTVFQTGSAPFPVLPEIPDCMNDPVQKGRRQQHAEQKQTDVSGIRSRKNDEPADSPEANQKHRSQRDAQKQRNFARPPPASIAPSIRIPSTNSTAEFILFSPSLLQHSGAMMRSTESRSPPRTPGRQSLSFTSLPARMAARLSSRTSATAPQFTKYVPHSKCRYRLR